MAAIKNATIAKKVICTIFLPLVELSEVLNDSNQNVGKQKQIWESSISYNSLQTRGKGKKTAVRGMAGQYSHNPDSDPPAVTHFCFFQNC